MPVELIAADQQFLEVAHVAHRLKVSPEFVRRLIRTGKLAAVPIGRRWRVSEAGLRAYLERQLAELAERGRLAPAAPLPFPHEVSR